MITDLDLNVVQLWLRVTENTSMKSLLPKETEQANSKLTPT